MARSWLVLREMERRRWGGDLRRAYLLGGLAERTGATELGWGSGALERTLRRLRGPRWQVWRQPPFVASTELQPPDRLETIAALGEPVLVDIHDDPVAQAIALGVPLEPEAAEAGRRRMADGVAAFRFVAAPSAPFARLAALPMDRLIVAGNGTDTQVISAEPRPDRPAVGFVSGAAPSRGIEELIEAVRLVRRSVPEMRLLLWLAGTGAASEAYLRSLAEGPAAEPWIEIGAAPYERMSSELGRATILCIPTPGHPYWDSVAPIKLFDGFAAGRPTLVTPRVETAEIVLRHEAGVVARGDDPDALAEGLLRLVGDDGPARAMGANARLAAERDYDWRVIGRRLADDLLARLD